MTVRGATKADGVRPRVDFKDGRLTTEPLTGVETFDGVRFGGRRLWSPSRSKMSAFVAKTGDLSAVPTKGSVLYLGAGNGYTASFVSDALAGDGDVYCVEFSLGCAKDLLALAAARPNLHPIIEDARHPERYAPSIPRADYLFQDISQPDQARIFSSHLPFARSGAALMLSLKLECLASGATADSAVARVEEAIAGQAVFDAVVDPAPHERGHLVLFGRKV